MRAKNLLNVGEVSKAMSAILSSGVAKVDSEVLNQLRTKHPQRPSTVRLPSMEVIKAERATWEEDIHAVIDVMDSDSKWDIAQDQRENQNEPSDHPSRFPWLVINEEDILAAAKRQEG